MVSFPRYDPPVWKVDRPELKICPHCKRRYYNEGWHAEACHGPLPGLEGPRSHLEGCGDPVSGDPRAQEDT